MKGVYEEEKSSEEESAMKREPSSADGASIEVVRRPRGRPPGSKNKPKPPIIITRDTESAMRPHVLEVPAGHDIVDAVARFAHSRNVGLCVLTGSGTVANVSLRQPSGGPTVTFHGRFDILSISATFLPPSGGATAGGNGFTISLAGAQGQIVGGSVAGTLLSAANVVLFAAVFTSPTYHRLPIEDEISGPVSAGTDTVLQPGAESIYSCHLPSEVIWAPTARLPPPQY
ncbi:AT-hook motif nuclear-localized protein 17-like [Tasmannia lanceolata]|uniref:AT-hook motif nuclear-localized protein 17-like n=1 Tax=Tasmannia lanceolata TaxID=3420 RepID=UPI004063E50A